MPRGDGTGPAGKGPGTGRGLGSCGAGQDRGLWARPYGRVSSAHGSRGIAAKLLDIVLDVVMNRIRTKK
jgi:hypothetical protein